MNFNICQLQSLLSVFWVLIQAWKCSQSFSVFSSLPNLSISLPPLSVSVLEENLYLLKLFLLFLIIENYYWIGFHISFSETSLVYLSYAILSHPTLLSTLPPHLDHLLLFYSSLLTVYITVFQLPSNKTSSMWPFGNFLNFMSIPWRTNISEDSKLPYTKNPCDVYGLGLG